MNIKKIAAFSHNNSGGNPAGVLVVDEMLSDKDMLKIANEVGYSETAFLNPIDKGWNIRYFSPEIEVPFCGHATIASGKALSERFGVGVYSLYLKNHTEIKIDVAESSDKTTVVSFVSSNTSSEEIPVNVLDTILELFNYHKTDLDPDFPVRIAFAGARHVIIVLKDRLKLSEMEYHFEDLKTLMLENDIITINLLWRDSDNRFHSRNAFASGGVYEDPATGAAAAAFAGYLRDIGWSGNNNIEILQGQDMGTPSRLLIEFTSEIGSGVKVAGETRVIS